MALDGPWLGETGNPVSCSVLPDPSLGIAVVLERLAVSRFVVASDVIWMSSVGLDDELLPGAKLMSTMFEVCNKSVVGGEKTNVEEEVLL